MPRPADFPNRRRLVARSGRWEDQAIDAHVSAARQLAAIDDDLIDEPAPRSSILAALADAVDRARGARRGR